MAQIENQIRIHAPKDAIFQALTTEAGIRGWWNRRAHISPDVGGESTYQFNKGGDDVHMRFRNEKLDPAGKVVWACLTNDNPSWIGTTVEWALEDTPEGVEVKFRHGGFAEEFRDTDGFRMITGGWQHFLQSLKTWIEDKKGQPFE
jgi:uncharacterized protein YndB with AHSA1/START domain